MKILTYLGLVLFCLLFFWGGYEVWCAFSDHDLYVQIGAVVVYGAVLVVIVAALAVFVSRRSDEESWI